MPRIKAHVAGRFTWSIQRAMRTYPGASRSSCESAKVVRRKARRPLNPAPHSTALQMKTPVSPIPHTVCGLQQGKASCGSHGLPSCTQIALALASRDAESEAAAIARSISSHVRRTLAMIPTSDPKLAKSFMGLPSERLKAPIRCETRLIAS